MINFVSPLSWVQLASRVSSCNAEHNEMHIPSYGPSGQPRQSHTLQNSVPVSPFDPDGIPNAYFSAS